MSIINPADIHSWLTVDDFLDDGGVALVISAAESVLRICQNIVQSRGLEPKFRRVRYADGTPADGVTPGPEMTLHGRASQPPPGAILCILRAISVRLEIAKQHTSLTPADVFVGFMTSALGFEKEGRCWLVLPPTAPLGPLDRGAVEAQKVLAAAGNLAQVRRDAAIAREMEHARRQREQEKQDQMQQIEEYRRGAEQRRLIKRFVQSLLRTIDMSTEQHCPWSPAHEAVKVFFASLLRGTGFTPDTRDWHPFFVGVVKQILLAPGGDNRQELGDSDFEQAEAMLRDALKGAGFACSGDGVKTPLVVTVRSTTTEDLRGLFTLLNTAFDAVVEVQMEKAEDQLNDDGKYKISTAAALRDMQQAREAQRERFTEEEGRSNQPPEVVTTAVGLINDIAAFVELCWERAGSRGFVSPHKSTANVLRQRFNKGEITVAQLHEMKDEWADRYEVEKGRWSDQFRRLNKLV